MFAAVSGGGLNGDDAVLLVEEATMQSSPITHNLNRLVLLL